MSDADTSKRIQLQQGMVSRNNKVRLGCERTFQDGVVVGIVDDRKCLIGGDHRGDCLDALDEALDVIGVDAELVDQLVADFVKDGG
nr:hypothetical protein [Allorhizocola rhizosphaerae]